MIKQLEIQKMENIICCKSIEIALNAKCNLNCKYCGAYHQKDIYKNRRLTVEEIISVLDEISTLERVKLSGGEVTLDFLDCLKLASYCKKRGLFYQINTNGTLLTHEKIIQLKEAGLSALHISLNFLDQNSYSNYYNVNKKLFDIIISNIQYASMNVECVVETLLFDQTINNLVELHKFIYSLGATGHEIQYGINQNHWNNMIEQNKVEEAIFRLCLEKAPEILLYFSCFEFPDSCKALDRFEMYINRDDIFFTNCIEGRLEFHLSDNGDVVGCELIGIDKIGNVFDPFNINDIKELPCEKRKRLLEICNHCPKKFYFT